MRFWLVLVYLVALVAAGCGVHDELHRPARSSATIVSGAVAPRGDETVVARADDAAPAPRELRVDPCVLAGCPAIAAVRTVAEVASRDRAVATTESHARAAVARGPPA